MCVIIHLPPLATINKRHLFNAVYNNWHGFGLVLRDSNNRLEVIKEFDDNGTDPERVWKLLEDNKDIHRHLHVRHSTKGSTDESNVQPFCVHNSDRRQVYFMHNGTLNSFGAYNGGKSDTLEFCEKVLAPSLSFWHGPEGKADYTHEGYLKLVVDKQWTSGSTGLFVSNDLEVQRIGAGWSEYKHPDDTSEGEVWVSNTSYFDRVQRGPEFQRLEEIRKAKEAEERAKNKEDVVDGHPFSDAPWRGGVQSGSNVCSINAIKLWNNSGCNKNPKVIKAINDIVTHWKLDEPAMVAKLKFVAYDEWLSFLDDESEYTVAALIEHLADTISKLSLELVSTRKSKDKAQKRLQEISLEKKGKENVSSEAA